MPAEQRDVDDGDWAGGVAVVPLDELERAGSSTRRGGSSSVSPARASCVRPPAADLDRRVRRAACWSCSPRKPVERGLERRRAWAPGRRPASARRRDRPSSTSRRSTTVARYDLSSREVVLDEPRGAARGTAAARREANGSSVPPCPIRRVWARRRTSATTSCDVGPAGLATTRTPSIPGASGWRGTASGGRAGGRRRRRAARPRRGRGGVPRRAAPRPSRPPRARGRPHRTRRSERSRRRRPASSAPTGASPSARPP